MSSGATSRYLGCTQQHHNTAGLVLQPHSAWPWPAQASASHQSRCSQLSPTSPLVKAGGRMRGKLASLKSGAFPEGNLMLMPRSFLIPCGNVIRAPQLQAWPRPLTRLGRTQECCSFSTCCQAIICEVR